MVAKEIVKTKKGDFIENDNNSSNIKKVISIEDTFIIQNFFNEQYYGVFDRDCYSFINTNIKIR